MINIQLYKGDCLEVMKKLVDNGVKVDAILADPPYGTTACKWDSVIPFEPMWVCLNQLIKDNGAIALFGSEPFSSALRMSNISMYRYDWIWIKNRPTGFLESNNKPMKKHEIISIFSKGHSSNGCKNRIVYNPQNLIEKNRIIKRTKRGDIVEERSNFKNEYISKYTNYPTSVLIFSSEKGYHPTQKPVALMEYLIKTYSKEGETVLDFTMGSGTTGVACKRLNRNFIGIELDDKYYNIAKERIDNA